MVGIIARTQLEGLLFYIFFGIEAEVTDNAKNNRWIGENTPTIKYFANVITGYNNPL